MARLIVFALFVVGSLSCGMLTHNYIANRAALMFASEKYPQYRDLIFKHPDAFQPGAPFPDWGYACGHHQAGEDAHWEPFQVAAIDYIAKEYPRPWDIYTEKLVVFLLGVASHYMADLNWHGLGEKAPRWATNLGHGFLKTEGAVNFDCHGSLCQTGHSAGDTGGEFVVASEFDISFLKWQWYVPVDDLAEIYSRMHEDVPAIDMQACMVLFFAAVHAEKLVTPFVLPYFNQIAPFLIDEMQSHFLGGTEDDAVWTQWKWHHLLDWLEGNLTSTNMETPPPSPFSREQLAGDGSAARFAHDLARRLGVDQLVTTTPVPGRGLILSADPAEVLALVPDKRDLSLSPAQQQKHLDTCQNDVDACVDLALSGVLGSTPWWATGESASALGSSTGAKQLLADVTLNGTQPFEHFGSSMCSADFNCNGIPDLAVGSYGYGIDGWPQLGRVQVFYDGSNTPATTLLGNQTMERFGWSVACLDMDQDGRADLVVSSPGVGEWMLDQYYQDTYRGSVSVFYGKPEGLASSKVPGLVLTASEHEDFANLGVRLLSADTNGDGFDDLVISTPFAYGGDGTQHQSDHEHDPIGTERTFVNRGLVAVLLSSPSLQSSRARPFDSVDWLQRGDQDYELLGKSVAVQPARPGQATAVLFVGSPGYKVSRGRVLAFDLGASEGGPLEPSLLFSLQGHHNLTDFGHAVALVPGQDNQPLLVVGSPTENVEPVLGMRAGVLRAFDLGGLSGNVSVADVEATSTILGSEFSARLGYAICTTTSKSGETALVVSSPFSVTASGVESGRLWVFNGELHKGQNFLSDAAYVVDGDRLNGRLGERLLCGSASVWAAAPRATLPAEEPSELAGHTCQQTGVVTQYSF